MESIKILANAKINLLLDVSARRADGYHELTSIMQSVSLADTLTVTPRADERVVLTASEGCPADGSNLVCRAAEAYFAAAGRRIGVDVKLEKRIPMAAGLGGGSADAAAMLRALDTLSDAPLGIDALCRVATTVGADVPFCLVGGTQLCHGIGEKMQPLSRAAGGALVVAVWGEGVSTPKAFAALDEIHNNFCPPHDSEACVKPLAAALREGGILAAAPHLFNCFEEVILPVRPHVAELKQALLDAGALGAMMSGTGPSVFGIFNTAREAGMAAARLHAMGATAFSCLPV